MDDVLRFLLAWRVELSFGFAAAGFWMLTGWLGKLEARLATLEDKSNEGDS